MYYFFIILLASLLPTISFAINRYEACNESPPLKCKWDDTPCRITQQFPRENNVCYIFFDSPTTNLSNNDTYETTLADDFTLSIN